LIALQIARFNPVYGEKIPATIYFKASLKLTDGTVIPLGGGVSSGYEEKDTTAKIHYSARFPEPILIDEIESIIICDTEYPL
jgi:hypothetical protein